MLSYIGRNLENLNARDAHERTGVLFLHAFPLTAAMWLPQIDAIAAAGFPVVAPHGFGVGGSPARAKWTMNDAAEYIFALTNSLNLHQVVVVGLSMGGYQAFALWKKHPKLIKALVLCDTRAEADTEAAYRNRYEFIDALDKNGSEEAVRRMIPKYFAKDTYKTNPDLITEFSEVIRLQQPSVIQSSLYALAEREDSAPLLPTVTVPTLVVVGEDDELTPPETARQIQRGIAGAELEVIKAAGHIPNAEQPVAFNHILLGFLKKNLSPVSV